MGRGWSDLTVPREGCQFQDQSQGRWRVLVDMLLRARGCEGCRRRGGCSVGRRRRHEVDGRVLHCLCLSKVVLHTRGGVQYLVLCNNLRGPQCRSSGDGCHTEET